MEGDRLMTSADVPATAEPELLSKGAYSLYRAPDGGMRLIYRPEGADRDEHLAFPAAIVRMAEAAAGGAGPLKRMRALVGGGAS
jgi:hypothetical protein